MKMRRIVLIILILLMSISGCSERSEDNTGESPGPSNELKASPSPSAQGEIPEASAAGEKTFEHNNSFEEKRFLWMNGIKINQMFLEQEVNEQNAYKVRGIYPQIEGLLNKEVQDSINKEFKDFFIEYSNGKFLTEDDTKDFGGEISVNYRVEANYNNLLSIGAYRYTSYREQDNKPFWYMTYDLNTGKKLILEDIFYKESDYIDLINKEIGVQILKRNIDEFGLRRPFDGIRGDEPFYITNSDLVITFRTGNSFFKESGMIYGDHAFMGSDKSIDFRIPIKDLKGTFSGYDKYWDPSRKIYDTDKLKKKMFGLTFKVNHETRSQDGKGYNLYLSYPEITNLDDINLQDSINSFITGKVDSLFSQMTVELKSKAKFATKVSVPTGESFISLISSFGDYFCFNCSWHYYIPVDGKEPTFYRAGYIYNVKEGKEVKFSELLKNKSEFIKTAVKVLGEKHSVKIDDKKFESVLNESIYGYDEENIHLFLPPDIRTDATQYISIPIDEFGQDSFKLFD